MEFEELYSAESPEVINRLKANFGVKAVVHVSADGYYSREFIDSNNIILRREVYRPDSLKFYQFDDETATILALNVTHKVGKTTFLGIKRRSDLKIAGHNVDIIMSEQDEKSDDGKPLKIYLEYYNDPAYTINPLIYKNMSVEGMEKVFSQSPYLTVGTKFVYNNRESVTALARRVIQAHVPAWHFEIPKNKTIVEQ